MFYILFTSHKIYKSSPCEECMTLVESTHTPNYTKIMITGILFSVGASVLSAIFGYLFRIILARGLSIEEYGTYYAVVGLFSVFGFLQSLGLKTALMKEIPVYNSQKNIPALKKIIWSSFGIWFGISTIISIITILLSKTIAVHYLKDFTLAPVIVTYSILFLLYPLESLLRSCFFGFQKAEYVSLMDVLKSIIVSLLTVILFLLIGNVVIAPVIAYILTYMVVTVGFGLPLLKRIFPQKTLSPKEKTPKTMRSFLSFGAMASITEIVELVLVSTDTVLITILSSLTEVGYYNVGMPTARILWRLIAPLSQIFLPLTSLLWSQGEREKLRQGIHELYHYSLILMLPSAFALMFYAKLVIITLFGSDYAPAVPVLQILAFSSIFCYLSKISTTTLMGIGKPELVTKITLVSSILNFIANIILIPIMGSVGAAIGTLLSFVILTVASQRQLNKQLGTRIIDNKTLRILFSGFLFVLITMFFQNIVVSANILGAILSTLVAGVLYIGALFLFRCLVPQDIRRIYKAVIR